MPMLLSGSKVNSVTTLAEVQFLLQSAKQSGGGGGVRGMCPVKF